MAMTWPAFGRFVAAKALSYWITHGGLSTFTTSAEADKVVGHKATLVFQRQTEAPASTRDLEMTSLYFLNPASVLDGDYFDSGDMDNVDTLIDGFWTQIRAQYDEGIQLLEVRHFKAGSEIASPDPSLGTTASGKPKQAPNPSVRVTHMAAPGTHSGSAASLPPQVACTITLATASRRHWGRLYLPAPTIDALDQTSAGQGRYVSSFVDSMATGWAYMAAQAQLVDLAPVVWSPTALSFLGIDNVHVDDTPDIQRRRRFASTRYIKQLTG